MHTHTLVILYEVIIIREKKDGIYIINRYNYKNSWEKKSCLYWLIFYADKGLDIMLLKKKNERKKTFNLR